MRMAGGARPASRLYHFLWSAVDWVFPPACPGCATVGQRWCADCQKRVVRLEAPLCPRCGEQEPRGQVCKRCRSHPPAFDALRSYGMFDGVLREALHRLKYKRDIALGEALSKHLIELYNQCNWEVDFIIPVPLSARRIQERGYNQSSLLARPLAYAAAKPYYTGALWRSQETRTQVGLSLNERRANVHGAFTADPAAVRGKVVLVIDDIATTGSTADACAQALRAAGAAGVYAFTLARAMIKTHTEAQPQFIHSKRR